MAAMQESMEAELRCPITLEMLQDPVTCTACQQTFSRQAVEGQRSCPLCRAQPLELAPNRFAASLLERVRERQAGEGYARHVDGVQFAYQGRSRSLSLG